MTFVLADGLIEQLAIRLHHILHVHLDDDDDKKKFFFFNGNLEISLSVSIFLDQFLITAFQVFKYMSQHSSGGGSHIIVMLPYVIKIKSSGRVK